jgi:hypothetical protein
MARQASSKPAVSFGLRHLGLDIFTALPGQLSYSAQIPVRLWLFAKKTKTPPLNALIVLGNSV